MTDLAPRFALPFPFSAYLMQTDTAPSPAAIWPYLSPAEQQEATVLLDRQAQRQGQGWVEWCLSRLAVKRAVSAVLGQSLPGASVEIRKYEGGAPYIVASGYAGPVPSISISHVGLAGLGAAAAPGWRIGIDYERPARIRDAAGFIETVTGDAERARLNLPVSAGSAALLWTLKEAAAKALGVGIQGRPQQFDVIDQNLAQGIAQVQHGPYIVDARFCSIHDAIFAIAWLRVAVESDNAQRHSFVKSL